MVADVVDAVVGVDTHRDTHEAEIALATGTPIATVTISNDSAGFAQLLGWIAGHAPGPRLVVSIEGTRSYGAGLARALAAAGLVVIECEQPARKARRGKGKSDSIDAHLAVLTALRCDAGQLPVPRADGDREALRILLGARHDLVTAHTAQINRLRALLLTGDDTDRQLARAPLPEPVLAALARRRLSRDASRACAVRQGELRRLALAVRQGRPRAHSQPHPAGGHRQRAGPRADRPPRDRPGQRRPGDRQLLPPRPVPHRRRVRRAGRHQPPGGQQRTHHPPPPQPRRRPSTQPRHPHHRSDPDALL
jgi:hypothetical protein